MKKIESSNIKIGEKIGRLTLLSNEIIGKYRKGTYLCDCGNIVLKDFYHVKNGLTKSCGCLIKEVSGNRYKTHGMSKTNEFAIWQGMIARCYNKNNNKYHRYGGRGIKVCERWLHNFEKFLEDMGKRPSLKHSIERINNDGNYEPSNCRWDIPFAQSRNNSRNHWIEYNGEKMILQDWADKLGFSQSYMSKLIKNMTIDEIIKKSDLSNKKPILIRKNKKGNIISKEEKRRIPSILLEYLKSEI